MLYDLTKRYKREEGYKRDEGCRRDEGHTRGLCSIAWDLGLYGRGTHGRLVGDVDDEQGQGLELDVRSDAVERTRHVRLTPPSQPQQLQQTQQTQQPLHRHL